MPRLFADTHPLVEEKQIELLRQAEPWQKMQMVAELNEMVKSLALAGLQHRFPNENAQTLRRRLADILLGSNLAEKAYGPLNESNP